MLVCPDCNHILTEETIPTDAPNGVVQVDRCPNCGGIWFDHYEINRLPTYYAIKLSNEPIIDEKVLVGKGICPHCNIKLERLTSESLSEKSHVMKCQHCQGHWASRKELVKVKKHQDTLLSTFKKINIPLPSIYAVIIPLVLVGLTTVLLSTAISEQKTQNYIRASQIMTAPVVIPLEITGNSRDMLVSFSTAKPVTSTITLYAPERSRALTLPINQTPSILHTIKLTGLFPSTTYTYILKVIDENGVETVSEDYKFTTQ